MYIISPTFSSNANRWNVERLKQGQKKQATSRLVKNHTTPTETIKTGNYILLH